MELMKLMKLTLCVDPATLPTSPILKAKIHLGGKTGAAGIFSSRQELCQLPIDTQDAFVGRPGACCYAVTWHHPRQRQTSNCINPPLPAFVQIIQFILDLPEPMASNEEPRPLPAVRVSKEESVLHVEAHTVFSS
jgi:hypothetical protein